MSGVGYAEVLVQLIDGVRVDCYPLLAKTERIDDERNTDDPREQQGKLCGSTVLNLSTRTVRLHTSVEIHTRLTKSDDRQQRPFLLRRPKERCMLRFVLLA
jgi:hypothetical protein